MINIQSYIDDNFKSRNIGVDTYDIVDEEYSYFDEIENKTISGTHKVRKKVSTCELYELYKDGYESVYYRMYNENPIQTDANGDVYILINNEVLDMEVPESYVNRLNQAFRKSLAGNNKQIEKCSSIKDVYKHEYTHNINGLNSIIKTGFYPADNRPLHTSDEEFAASILLFAGGDISNVSHSW